jgi:hypothetical protein
MKTVEIKCNGCGEEIEIANNVWITLNCQKCGSGDLSFNGNMQQECLKGHIEIGEKAWTHCKACKPEERSAVRKISYLSEEVNYIEMKKKDDLKSFCEKKEISLNINWSKSTLTEIKIAISQALNADNGERMPSKSENEKKKKKKKKKEDTALDIKPRKKK